MSIQRRCSIVFNPKIQYAILVLIVLNALSLGLETINGLSAQTKQLLEDFDTFALYVYVIELTLKHIAQGFKFWKDGWNIFDFVIVAIAFIPAGSSLSVFRGLRILRVLRLVSTIRPLKIIVVSLLKAIPSIGWLILLVLINIYLYAVIGTNFFGERFPEFFGSLENSFFTLFQIMTLESWSMGIARPILQEFDYAYVYFVSFILINTFVMLNLFVGVIVNAMSNIDNENTTNQNENKSETMSPKNSHPQDEDVLTELDQLKKQLAVANLTIERLCSRIEKNSN